MPQQHITALGALAEITVFSQEPWYNPVYVILCATAHSMMTGLEDIVLKDRRVSDSRWGGVYCQGPGVPRVRQQRGDRIRWSGTDPATA